MRQELAHNSERERPDRGARALHDPSGDDIADRVGQRTDQRSDAEGAQRNDQQAPPPEDVAQAPEQRHGHYGREQEPDRQPRDGDDRRAVRRGEHRQRRKHDRRLEPEVERPEGEHQQPAE